MQTNIIGKNTVSITPENNSSINFVKLYDESKTPKRSNDTDAGYDLYSIENKTIKPKSRVIIKTGISMAIPNGLVGLIWPRSGLAVKYGIDTLAGVIDSGYRGEICVVLQNHGDKTYEVKSGDRIAQILFQSVECVYFNQVSNLEESQRGSGGFGSSGA